jgi:tungstate transport system ATP-binding protein
MGLLSLRDVQHAYGGRRVLSIGQLDLERGSVAAVVGPNGSGKSTLLRLLACVEAPTQGSVLLDGQAVRTAAERRRARQRITLVEQRPFLFAGTARENLRYALSLHGLRGPGAEPRLSVALERLGIGDLGDRNARALSEGEGQKVAIARALALEPDLLLLDEPASAADPTSTGALYRILDEERRRGAALCFASHQLEDAYRWSDRLLALADGQASPVTPENLFRADLPPGSGTKTVHAGPLTLQVYTDKSGPAILALPPDDIVVSSEPLHSSARNAFAGRIRRISEDGRGGVTLAVDAGADLVVRITHSALAELGLTIGSPVVLSIKTMAVRVF